MSSFPAPSIQFSFQDFSLESFALPRASIHTERSPARLGYHEDTYPSYALEEDHAAKLKGRLRHKFSSAFSKIFQKSNKLSPFRKQVPPEESHIVSTLPPVRAQTVSGCLQSHIYVLRRSHNSVFTCKISQAKTSQFLLVNSRFETQYPIFVFIEDSTVSTCLTTGTITLIRLYPTEPQDILQSTARVESRSRMGSSIPHARGGVADGDFLFPQKGTVPYNISW
ncbi:hypothetical protein BT69DRAFT_749452 [Atractiella rhizophila]|nr:hypothetical protein BT69DRAFT_749452 [Atractiella rhizophila]